MKILISAAEASSDLHGANLLKALRQIESSPIEAFGIGGPRLEAEGLRVVVKASDLLVMGFVEILSRLPRLYRALRQIEQEAKRLKPEVAVLIDYPDFHFILAKRLKRLGIKTIYFIPPKVWAWRQGRVEKLRRLFVRVLGILPFEREFYRNQNVPFRYVGSPLLDELPLAMSKEQARAALGVGADVLLVACLAGSRPSELEHNLEAELEAVRLLALKMRVPSRETVAWVVLPRTADVEVWKERIDRWEASVLKSDLKSEDTFGPKIRVSLSQGNSGEVMRASDLGVIKSGTSTLEAAALGLPHVVIYRGVYLSWLLFKWVVRYRGPVALSNLVSGVRGDEARDFKELLGPFATPEAIADELHALLTDAKVVARVQSAVKRVELELDFQGGSPSARAAREVMEVCREH